MLSSLRSPNRLVPIGNLQDVSVEKVLPIYPRQGCHAVLRIERLALRVVPESITHRDGTPERNRLDFATIEAVFLD